MFSGIGRVLSDTIIRQRTEMPEFELVMGGLDRRLREISSVFLTGTDYLQFALAKQVLHAVCSDGVQTDHVSADAVRLASSGELVYQWVFDLATMPMGIGSFWPLEHFASGLPATDLAVDPASAALVALRNTIWPRRTEPASPGEVELISPGSMSLSFGTDVLVSDHSMSGASNGRVDHGDLIELTLRQQNRGSLWRFSESLLMQALPPCAAVFSRSGEVVLAEQPPNSSVRTALPALYLSDSCSSTERIDFLLASSRESSTDTVTLTIRPRSTYLSIMPMAMEEDEPGSSRYDDSLGLGPLDAVELLLRASTRQVDLDLRIRNATVLPWRRVEAARLVQFRSMPFASGAGDRLAIEDLDVQSTLGVLPPLATDASVMDSLPFVWVVLDVDGRVSGTQLATPGSFDPGQYGLDISQLFFEFERTAGPVLGGAMSGDTATMVQALASAARRIDLPAEQVRRVMEAQDTLTCGACDSRDARDLARRVMLTEVILGFEGSDPAEGSSFSDMLNRSAVESVVHYRSMVLQSLMESMTGTVISYDDARELLEEFVSAGDVRSAITSEPQYRWRRFVGVQL
jgi:hypothetical protein